MGYYINPKDGTKEEWLAANARPITAPNARNWDFNSNELPICLVDNFHFTSAAIAYCPEEVMAFYYAGDGRPTRWFAATLEKLAPFYTPKKD